MIFARLCLSSQLLLASVCVLFGACYRTPLLPPACDLEVKPAALAFGQLLPGEAQTLTVTMVNHGEDLCHLKNVAISSKSDAGFAIDGVIPTTVGPSATVNIAVTFQPASASIPLHRKGELAFDVDSVKLNHGSVPLTATVVSDCRLAVSPANVDFGHVAIDTSATRTVRAVNTGKTDCEIGTIAIRPDSDSQFHVGTVAALVTLAPGEESSIPVTFDARDATRPHRRTGTLTFVTNDEGQTNVAVPLSADIDVGCDLSWEPASIDFGSVSLNKTVSRQVTLSNLGSAACLLTNVAIAQDSASSFGLTSSTASLVVSVGGTASLGVSFFADSSSPHDKTGTLVFQTGDTRDPTGRIPLTGHVNTACEDASHWIYTFDSSNVFARFDPTTLTFTDIATLHCAPRMASPFSMAVDQHAVAWVHYDDGSLYKVDTTTGACESTSFKANQHGILVFGMGFVFDPSTGQDRLYIAGGGRNVGTQSQLATVSFPDLVVTPIGTVTSGSPELTGTGDGQLWGFSPQNASSTSVATLFRLDPTSGATIESYGYPSISDNGAWSMKFWGGKFWIFLGRSVYKVSRDKPKVVETVIADTGRAEIVGAGVSTCAPL